MDKIHRNGAWTAEQQRIVAELYPTQRSLTIARLVGRSVSAVDHFASRNGIRKTAEATFAHKSESRMGSGTPNFKGYRRKTRKGYWARYAPWHPKASKDGLVMEHRLVMEGLLGRKLEPSEVVHHINGDKSDNRPENLMLMGFAEHTTYHNVRRNFHE